MERSLRNRLTFGPIMLLVLFGLLWVDNYIENSTIGTVHQQVKREYLGGSQFEEKAVRVGGLGLLALLLLILPPRRELAQPFCRGEGEAVPLYRGGRGGVAGGSCVPDPIRLVPADRRFHPGVYHRLCDALCRPARAMVRQTQEAIHHMAGTVAGCPLPRRAGWFLMALRVKHSYWPDGRPRLKGRP